MACSGGVSSRDPLSPGSRDGGHAAVSVHAGFDSAHSIVDSGIGSEMHPAIAPRPSAAVSGVDISVREAPFAAPSGDRPLLLSLLSSPMLSVMPQSLRPPWSYP